MEGLFLTFEKSPSLVCLNLEIFSEKYFGGRRILKNGGNDCATLRIGSIVLGVFFSRDSVGVFVSKFGLIESDFL